jgi:thioredoxin-related protein
MVLGLVLASLIGINLGEGLDKGKIENKWVFVYLTSNDCPYCVALKKQTLTNNNVIPYLDCCVVVEDNISYNRETYNLFNKLFSSTSFQANLLPSYYLINPHTRKFQRWGNGFKSPTEFIQWIDLTK